MQRLRTIVLIGAWVGLVWMVFTDAEQMRASDIFWVNLLHNVALIFLAVIIVVAVNSFVGRIMLKPPQVVLVVTTVIVLLAIAAVDIFWLRNLLAQL